MVKARQSTGVFRSIGDLLGRSGLPREALENLARAGAMDGLAGADGRRSALWQVGVGYRAGVRRGQLAFPLAGAPTPAGLEAYGRWDRMRDDYAMLGMCPDGQIMELYRAGLGPEVLTSDALGGCADGDVVRVAGRVVRRQRPLANAVFLTLEDEYGLVPVMVWDSRWPRLRHALRQPLAVVEGEVSRRDGTLNLVAAWAWPLGGLDGLKRRADWR